MTAPLALEIARSPVGAPAARPAGNARLLDLDALYRGSVDRFRRIAAGLGLSPGDAEDALHESYVRLIEVGGRLREPGDAVRWLTRVVINACRLQHRLRRRERIALRGRALPLDGQRGRADDGSDDAARVRAALDELGEEDRALLALRYFCAMNAAEIGALLQTPAATIRGRLRAARLRLAKRMLEGRRADE